MKATDIEISANELLEILARHIMQRDPTIGRARFSVSAEIEGGRFAGVSVKVVPTLQLVPDLQD